MVDDRKCEGIGLIDTEQGESQNTEIMPVPDKARSGRYENSDHQDDH